MQAPALALHEPERLAALASYAVLDTPAEAAFDALTRLVAHLLGMPISLVTLVDLDRQWFKSRYGIDAAETARDVSFCGHVVALDRPLVVGDMLHDLRFSDNPLVAGPPGVRFYAGYPLRTAEGHVLGTLCAIDVRPRDLEPQQLEILEILAGEVMAQLELRRKQRLLAEALAELSGKNATLARLNEEKSTLLGMAAHDLRNPIASIQGHAALLLEVDLDAEQRRRALESIGRVSRQMLVMVNDLLDVSVIESGRLELRRERCALHELLGQRVEFFGILAARKSISIATRIGEVAAEVDPQRIEQVIDNLLSNAVKYSPPGASVDVSLAIEGQDAVLAVRDRGPGLTEEDRQRLFGAFQRLSARPTGGEKSTGLGLAITQRIVTAHGGRIEVESAPGQGATFRVRLPLIHAAEQSAAAPSRGPADGLTPSPVRVLMVDDDEDIREAVQLALEGEAGFDLRVCASLEEALAELAHFTPDLLLLDVEMPGSDGPATLGRLRLEPGVDRTPFLFLTARSEPDRVARYRELGALEVIEKPFDLPALGGSLRRALQRALPGEAQPPASSERASSS
jgi:two-component system, sensor histidine kinase